MIELVFTCKFIHWLFLAKFISIISSGGLLFFVFFFGNWWTYVDRYSNGRGTWRETGEGRVTSVSVRGYNCSTQGVRITILCTDNSSSSTNPQRKWWGQPICGYHSSCLVNCVMDGEIGRIYPARLIAQFHREMKVESRSSLFGFWSCDVK